jgi:uncharacterized protein (TIGR02145 family)
MTDQEGNVYKTIVIGTQEWMAENLNTSIFRNGDPIPTDLDNTEWQNTTNGSWTYPNNDSSNACPFGKLYNWYACADTRQLCPTGWHVPNDAEWSVMTDYIGGENTAGGKMKSTGTVESGTGLWIVPNTDATNESGFSGVPGGLCNYIGGPSAFGSNGYWWSSSDSGPDYAWLRYLNYFYNNSYRADSDKQNCFSVRCLKD